MDIDTWNILGMHVWPAADVHITLFQKARKQHKRNDKCSECCKAARTNRKCMEKMTGKCIPMFDLEDYWADREVWENRMGKLEAEEQAAEEDVRLWLETYKAKRKLQAKKRTMRMLEKHMIGKTEKMEKMSLDEGGEKEVERVVEKMNV
jgi:hypothetical protein